MFRRLLVLGLAAVATAAFAGPAMAKSGLFVSSAVEHGDGTVTLPLYHGTSAGRDVWFVVLDASSGSVADRLGVNRAPKLANAAGTAAVQEPADATLERVMSGTIDFPGTVDFGHGRQVVGTGFPPTTAEPGPVGDALYSPLIRLRDGTVLNAPQVANTTGQADKVVGIDMKAGTVTYKETEGFQGDRAVRYVSTDASDPVAAALEDATYAPNLNAAPSLDDDGTDSARASLAAFTNGALAPSPERQGLNSAIHDHQDPLNVLRWNPSQGRYSPLWDVHLAAWAEGVTPTVQRDWNTVEGLVDHGLITGFGEPFRANGFIVDCPIVFRAG